MIDTQTEHIHLWSRTLDGCELANAMYYDDKDAAVAFTGIVSNITKYNNVKLTVEEVMESLAQGGGMYTGVPGFIMVISHCAGNCTSCTWN